MVMSGKTWRIFKQVIIQLEVAVTAESFPTLREDEIFLRFEDHYTRSLRRGNNRDETTKVT